MTVTCIAAVSSNGVIGKNGKLPWRLPADLKHFREATWGKSLVLGRKTYDSLKGPLPGRKIIVISGTPRPDAQGIRWVRSFDDALRLCRGEEDVMIGGGEAVYRAALPIADRVDLTLVHATFEGDAHFPLESLEDFELIRDRRHAADEKNPHDYSFRLYERRRAA